MPPQRNPLGSISGNRQKNQWISPYMRGKVMGCVLKGATPAEIAMGLNLERGTVRYTIAMDPLRHEGHSLPKDPRRKSYSLTDERYILRYVRLHPKDTYDSVITACGLSCSKSTLKKILKRHGITNWRCKKRPELTEAHVAKRLAWCLAHRGWTVEEWGLVVWSDECSVERGRGKRQE
jgi:hypothetical protein